MALVFVIGCFPAVSAGAQEEVIHYSDGSYLVVTIEEVGSRATGTKSGSKVSRFYGNDDELKWTVTLSGTFTYDGTSSNCTSANVTVNIVDDDWYTVSQSSNRNGNNALADVVMGRKLLGVTVKKTTVSLTLSCDKNGNLS